MDSNNWYKKYRNSLLLLIPAILVLFLALIPTLKYQWPLSLDIIGHVHLAKVYTIYGLTLKDPLINPPSGEFIGYPPLFHLLIAALGTILKVDYFQVAKLLQPILAVSIVLTITYVTKEFYGTIAGISAGIIIFSGTLVSRIILPIPENLALIFLISSIFFYYKSASENKNLFALMSGLLFILVVLTHQGATLTLFLIITSITLVSIILFRKIKFLKVYGIWIAPIALIIVGVAILIFILSPDLILNVLNGGITGSTGYVASLPQSIPTSLLSYPKQLGIMVIIFGFIGGALAIKKRELKDIYLVIWALTMFMLSISYLFNVNVISYRILIYILIPLSMLAGFGVSFIYSQINDRSKNIGYLFLIITLGLSFTLGIYTVEDPKMAVFGSITDNGPIQVAPPSSSDMDVVRWFSVNGDPDKTVLTSNHYSGIFLVTMTGQPIEDLYTDQIYMQNDTDKSELIQSGIGYILFDKRIVHSKSGNDKSAGNLIYYNESFQKLSKKYAVTVYENKDYIIWKL